MTLFYRVLYGAFCALLFVSQIAIPAFAEEMDVKRTDTQSVSQNGIQQEQKYLQPNSEKLNEYLEKMNEYINLSGSLEKARFAVLKYILLDCAKSVPLDDGEIINEVKHYCITMTGLVMAQFDIDESFDTESYFSALMHTSDDLIKIAGDVNNDGKLTVADGVLLARIVAEDETAPVSAKGLANADVNGDYELTSEDTTELLRMLTNN